MMTLSTFVIIHILLQKAKVDFRLDLQVNSIKIAEECRT